MKTHRCYKKPQLYQEKLQIANFATLILQSHYHHRHQHHLHNHYQCHCYHLPPALHNSEMKGIIIIQSRHNKVPLSHTLEHQHVHTNTHTHIFSSSAYLSLHFSTLLSHHFSLSLSQCHHFSFSSTSSKSVFIIIISCPSFMHG